MSGKSRIDTPDTVEMALHQLVKLQSEGWGTRRVEFEIDYGKPGKNAHRLPIGATLTIRLIPGV